MKAFIVKEETFAEETYKYKITSLKVMSIKTTFIMHDIKKTSIQGSVGVSKFLLLFIRVWTSLPKIKKH